MATRQETPAPTSVAILWFVISLSSVNRNIVCHFKKYLSMESVSHKYLGKCMYHSHWWSFYTNVFPCVSILFHELEIMITVHKHWQNCQKFLKLPLRYFQQRHQYWQQMYLPALTSVLKILTAMVQTLTILTALLTRCYYQYVFNSFSGIWGTGKKSVGYF
mgnify:CR=1 FL=1